MSLNTTIDDTSPLIIYRPSRSWYQGGAGGDAAGKDYWSGTKTWTQSQGASASFNFSGTSITLLGAKRANHGAYSVRLDDSIENFDGFAPDPGIFQTVLFKAENLSEGMHQVVLTNTASNGDKGYLDLDAITWTADVTHGSSNRTLLDVQVQDDDPHFVYGPSGAWSTNMPELSLFSGASGHSTHHPGAFANLSFSGDAVSLYGSIGPSNAQYSIYLDDVLKGSFSSKRDIFAAQVLLYQGNGLGSGTHHLSVLHAGDPEAPDSNTPPISPQKRADGDDDGGERNDSDSTNKDVPSNGAVLAIDYVVVSKASTLVQAPVSVSSPFPLGTSQPSRSNGHVAIQTGTVIAIAVSVLAILILLIALILVLNRRNKRLWSRLQKGYMVQSHFDASPRLRPNASAVSLESSATSRARYHAITHFPINQANDSQATLSDHHTRTTSNKSALSDPFSPQPGDNRIISETAYQSAPAAQISTSVETTLGHQRDPSDRRNPLRSQTADTMNSQVTASTLVAEPGSVENEAPARLLLKLVPRWGTLGRRRDTPPTVIEPAFSGNRGRQRSLSPSKRRLLHDHSEDTQGMSGREVPTDMDHDMYMDENLDPEKKGMLAEYRDTDIMHNGDTESMHTISDSPTVGVMDEAYQRRRINQLMMQNHLSYTSVATLPVYRAQNSPRNMSFDEIPPSNISSRTPE